MEPHRSRIGLSFQKISSVGFVKKKSSQCPQYRKQGKTVLRSAIQSYIVGYDGLYLQIGIVGTSKES